MFSTMKICKKEIFCARLDNSTVFPMQAKDEISSMVTDDCIFVHSNGMNLFLNGRRFLPSLPQEWGWERLPSLHIEDMGIDGDPPHAVLSVPKKGRGIECFQHC